MEEHADWKREIESRLYDVFVKYAKANPKLVAKQAELAKVENEIENLIDSLKSAGTALVPYINTEIEKLDIKRL